MSKREEITVSDNYQYPKVSKVKLAKDKLYREKTTIVKKEIVLDKSLSSNGQIKQIDSYFSVLETRKKQLLTNYLFLKLFRLSANKDDDFNKDILSLEKYINKFKTDYGIIFNLFLVMKNKSAVSLKEIDEAFDYIQNLFSFIKGLKDDLNVFQNKYFHEFKLSSYTFVRGKSVEEIEDLIERVDKELLKFKNIEEANDYCIYNSGNEITDVVNSLIKLKKKDNNSLGYHYFLNQDAIIAFKFNEWIELFIKFNFVLTKLGNSVMYTSDFKQKYRDLETRYAIVSIYSEVYR